MKKTTQKVTVTPVLLPGCKEETAWDTNTTHQGNYTTVGIVSDPNKVGKTGRNSTMLVQRREGEDSRAVATAKKDADNSIASTATVGGDEVRGLVGQVRSTGLAPPKRLTTKQRRIVSALVVRIWDGGGGRKSGGGLPRRLRRNPSHVVYAPDTAPRATHLMPLCEYVAPTAPYSTPFK